MSGSPGSFMLPSAWRATSTSASSRLTVPIEDLIGGLDALAAECGADLTVTVLAAHLSVLSMLSEDPAFSTDVVQATGAAHTVVMDRTGMTWQQLVLRVWKDEQAPAEPEPATRAPGRVLFCVGELPSQDTGHALRVSLEAGRLLLHPAAGVLSPRSAATLRTMYRSVLTAMAADSDGDASLAHLPPDERRAVLHTWSTGPVIDRGPATTVELFEAQAERTPDAVAVRLHGATLTYRQVDERANQIARRLVDLGARPDALIGVCLRRDADLLPALLGVWKSGAGYLPLDPSLPAERLRQMIDASGCRQVLGVAEHASLIGDLDGGFIELDTDRAQLEALPTAAVDVVVAPSALAYVIYTSGSTGTPKGVMIEHSGLANYLRWTAEAYAARGTGGAAVFSSISFDLGIPSLFTPLITGQAVHLLPDPLNTADLGELLAEGAPYSFIKLTPGHLDLLSLDLTPGEIHGLAGLVIAAGDAFTTELASRWATFAGPGGTPVATEYGPTEITIGNSGQPIDTLPGSELIPLGRPIPNTTMYVLREDLQPVPVGVPGEIYIGGVGVARGYLGRPDLTEERFRPDPYSGPGARLYRTGDRARWLPDGSLEFLGRTDHQVKIRGYRVELGEIQAVLHRHPQVGEAVVIAGGGPKALRLAAFVIAAPDRSADPVALRAHLAESLPDYMVPAAVVPLEQFPLTPNGKIDQRALQKLL